MPEAILRFPQASLFVVFASAFAVFALTSNENDLARPKKRRKSFFKTIYKHLIGDEADGSDLTLEEASSSATISAIEVSSI